MFRFLTDRYPLILQSLTEKDVFDNFYLDMNGIIHQCTHPDDNQIAILDTEAMYEAIFGYTERLFRIVCPRKLMYLAVDGVAPRAKMNQQRARRFRSAKEAERYMMDVIARGEEVPKGVPFDSNCITPGTEFMTELSLRFREWIDYKMATDSAWQQGCTVVFSGSEVPGEGEHKLVDYIRKWRISPDYDPSIRHCMYGLDADLMMLGLVAHVPHFTLLREKIRFGRKGVRKVPKMRGTSSDAEEFNLLEIALLRDMLYIEFTRPNVDPKDCTRRPDQVSPSRAGRESLRRGISANNSHQPSSNVVVKGRDGESKRSSGIFKYDSKRIVDDFVFICMLVGNDFLPNLPHLDIADGALNLMFRIYKELVLKWRGYLTQDHRLHPDRLEEFLSIVGKSEKVYFENRAFDDGIPEYRTEEYRRAYYKKKFGFDVNGSDGPAKMSYVRRIYFEGLHWCLQYYHRGVTSWNWFYPEFYAPLASDMVGLRSVRVSFNKGKPFSPITQLMAVLPPHSAQFLPLPMRNLMISPSSPVSDFYPPEFEIDQNGKRNSWEAVVIIPFIDECRLLAEIAQIDHTKELSVKERKRDKLGVDHWFRAEDYPRSKDLVRAVRPTQFTSRNLSLRNRSPSPRIVKTRSVSPESERRLTAAEKARGRSVERVNSPKAGDDGDANRRYARNAGGGATANPHEAHGDSPTSQHQQQSQGKPTHRPRTERTERFKSKAQMNTRRSRSTSPEIARNVKDVGDAPSSNIRRHNSSDFSSKDSDHISVEHRGRRISKTATERNDPRPRTIRNSSRLGGKEDIRPRGPGVDDNSGLSYPESGTEWGDGF